MFHTSHSLSAILARSIAFWKLGVADEIRTRIVLIESQSSYPVRRPRRLDSLSIAFNLIFSLVLSEVLWPKFGGHTEFRSPPVG